MYISFASAILDLTIYPKDIAAYLQNYLCQIIYFSIVSNNARGAIPNVNQ